MHLHEVSIIVPGSLYNAPVYQKGLTGQGPWETAIQRLLFNVDVICVSRLYFSVVAYLVIGWHVAACLFDIYKYS